MSLGYTGATKRTTLEEAREIVRSAQPGRWAVQRKMDGCYVTITTGADGEVTSIRTRNGREAPYAAEILGQIIGAPDSVLCAEWEAHTEVAEVAATARGYRVAHVFDMLQIRGRDISKQPYAQRYGEAMSAHLAVSMSVRGDATRLVRTGRRHSAANRFASARPINWRLAPMLESAPASELEAVWSEYVVGEGGEGLVLVDTMARAGKAASKLKVKQTETHDLVITSITPTECYVHVGEHTLGMYRPTWVREGMLVEVACDGYYAGGCPRFARVIRPRGDISLN